MIECYLCLRPVDPEVYTPGTVNRCASCEGERVKQAEREMREAEPPPDPDPTPQRHFGYAECIAVGDGGLMMFCGGGCPVHGCTTFADCRC